MSLPFAPQKVTPLKVTQAVILAGGAGTRLRPFTLKNPKPLVPVNGIPFLAHLISLLKQNGIKEIIILTGYLGEKIPAKFGDGSRFGIKIKYSYTPFNDYSGEEIKSGVRILNAHELLSDLFLLLYCDNYLPFDIKRLEKLFAEKNAEVLVTAYSNKDNSTKNNMFISEGYVRKYDKTRTYKKLNSVDIGYMIVNKKVLEQLPKTNSKFEDIIFPKLIKSGKLAGYLTDQKYYSIGDPKRVKVTADFLKAKKIIFLDRDGVINKKAGKADYIKNWSEFTFLPGSLEAIRILTESGYKIFIITNQPGIARKKMTKSDLDLIHKNMLREIKKSGGKIEKIYYCPHGWDQGCICRKPEPGMLLQASRENLIDLTKAVFIGDDERDKEAGEAALCKTILLRPTQNLLQIVEKMVTQR